MNPFAAKLTEYINADGRTVARICRESGGKVRTVTLHAYKDGRRLPKDASFVFAAANALGLGSVKTDALHRAYVRSVNEATVKRTTAKVQS